MSLLLTNWEGRARRRCCCPSWPRSLASHLAIARKARSAPTRRPRSPVAYVVALLTQPSLSSLPYPIVAAIRALIDGKSHGGDGAPSQQCGGGVQGPCQLPACAAAASPKSHRPQECSGSTIGRGIYFGHFRLKKLRLHRSAAKKSRQRLWHDDAASARFQPSSGRGRRSRWRAPPRSVGEFVCSWGHHSGRHALCYGLTIRKDPADAR